MARRQTTFLLMLGYWLLGLAGGLCIKEGGTDAPHRWIYFVVGNAFGISSTAMLMGVYARMNVNLAMVITTSGAFFLFQLLLWVVYRTPITSTQGFGILLVGVGIALAVRPRRQEAAVPSESESASPVAVGEEK